MLFLQLYYYYCYSLCRSEEYRSRIYTEFHGMLGEAKLSSFTAVTVYLTHQQEQQQQQQQEEEEQSIGKKGSKVGKDMSQVTPLFHSYIL